MHAAQLSNKEWYRKDKCHTLFFCKIWGGLHVILYV